MSDNYIETIENTYGIAKGRYFAEWYRSDVMFRTSGASYVVRITHYQNTPAVPVTLVVDGYLIDVYYGHIKE